MRLTVSEPKIKNEFEKYYDLRWRILRKPWKQPKGTEKDNLEKESIHIIIKNEKRQIIGVGRGHFNSPKEAQIRYMAIEKNKQGKGLGSLILKELEKRLKKRGAKYIVLNARESASKFYEKHGYRIIKKAHTLFGSIPHFKMKKTIS